MKLLNTFPGSLLELKRLISFFERPFIKALKLGCRKRSFNRSSHLTLGEERGWGGGGRDRGFEVIENEERSSMLLGYILTTLSQRMFFHMLLASVDPENQKAANFLQSQRDQFPLIRPFQRSSTIFSF